MKKEIRESIKDFNHWLTWFKITMREANNRTAFELKRNSKYYKNSDDEKELSEILVRG